MGQDTEYATQRPSCEFFLGICVGYGIPVQIDPVSDLLKTDFLYGYDEAARGLRRQELEERELWFRVLRDQELQTIQQALTKVTHHNAMIADAAHFRKQAAL